MKLRNVTLILGLLLVSCLEKDISEEKMKTVPYVDIKKFMGDWYVIANIPTFLEKNATNAGAQSVTLSLTDSHLSTLLYSIHLRFTPVRLSRYTFFCKLPLIAINRLISPNLNCRIDLKKLTGLLEILQILTSTCVFLQVSYLLLKPKK